MGGLGVLLLVAGIWSVTGMHFAEAKGMPKYWLNSDGTIKQQYIKNTTPVSAQVKIFPIVTGMTKHDAQKIRDRLLFGNSR